MSHSPFPWSTHPQVRTSVFNAYGVKVATTTGPNAEDNAALIAAIPAMVHALQKIATIADDMGKPITPAHEAADIARAVLASIGKTAPAK